VRYTGSGTEKRICRTVGDNTACYRVKAQATPSGCRLTTTTYDAIKMAIAAGNTGIVDAGVNFAFVMAHSVQGFAGSRICAAPGFVATTDSLPTGIDILDTEEALLVRYKINGGGRNGKIEKRLCHTVANKTDCFRLYQ
jgi:hypothetical protein